MKDSVQVPFASLSPEALRGLIEEFVTREGTDYGPQELSLHDKSAQVQRCIERGEVLVVYDFASESATLVTREEWSER
jgi:hypothetical protein